MNLIWTIRQSIKALYSSRCTVQQPWEGVPRAYRDLAVPSFSVPKDLSQWCLERPHVQNIVLECLGDLPPRPKELNARTVWERVEDGYLLEKFVFDNGVDSEVPGYIALPKSSSRVPAIVTIHGHGGCKDEIFGHVPSAHAVVAPLTRRGYAVLAIDNYFSGERKGNGPDGSIKRWRSSGNTEELSLYKLNIWLGRSLWGMMLRDQQIAIDYLTSRSEIDSGRIGVQGMSMGSTASWWLAAIDERVKVAVAIGCFTRYEDLLSTRGLGNHGIYYFVQSILRYFDTEAIMALIAPRPFLALTGDRDGGSPPSGIRKLEQILRQSYALYGKSEHFQSIVFERTGHIYTLEMKERMISWFDRFL